MKNPVKECREILLNLAPLDAERNPEFALEIERLSRTGLWLASLFAIVGPLVSLLAFVFMGGAIGYLPAPDANSLPIAADTLVVILGLAGLGLSGTRVGASSGRLITGAMAVLMFAGYTLQNGWYGLATGSPPQLGLQFVLLMLICVGALPFQLWQTAALGAALTVTYYGSVALVADLHGLSASPAPLSDLTFFGMVTAFCVGISGILYGTRYRHIRERQEKEEALKTVTFSAKKYRSLFATATDAIFVIDNNTNRFAEVNEAFVNLVGIPAEELYETHFMDVIAEESRAEVADKRARRRAGEDVPWRYPIRIIRRGAPEPLICDMTIHRVQDPQFSMGAVRDITESVKAEEYARKLAQIPEENPNPVIRCDYDGVITYQNPSAQRITSLLGLDEGAVALSDLLPDDFVTNVRQAIDTGKTILFHMHKTHGRTLSITYNPYSKAREVYVWLMDVTERVNAYEQVKSHAAELEAKNRELQETRAQLVQTEKMAAIGNLVAGVAHEINTPLGAIKSNMDIAARAVELLTERQDKGVEQTQSKADPKTLLPMLCEATKTSRLAVDRISDIVKSLNNFVRLDDAECKFANLHEGIESTLTLLRHQLKDRITVVRKFGDLPEVECFPNRINQVFMNVLVNAIQAIDGPGTITIETLGRNTGVEIRISDTGRGIAVDELPKIFDPGYTTKGVGVGTGLGLSIVYRIVTAHKGTISAESELGKGTTITIHLPTCAANAERAT